MASGRRANDAMVSAKPYVDTVNWTKGIHASAPERECDMMCIEFEARRVRFESQFCHDRDFLE